MYPEEFVKPMREELTRSGFRELRTAQDVDAALKDENRTVLVVVNSICGCAAGKARPAIVNALGSGARPEVLTTVFAGQDQEATARARSYFTGYAPSSPSIALMREGKVAFMLERRDIETSDPITISHKLKQAFEKFCTPAAVRQ
ncbi:MAG TPA: BrxA/BrxB family bacilliredoxin [Candidatus Aquilonibacter sp.]|nr:BrxA/BrxB family bacilliredoxin [Candidatus Aquilonibacter sp.]